VWWTGEGGGIHGSVEAGTSPEFDIRRGVGRTLRNGDIGFRVEGAVAGDDGGWGESEVRGKSLSYPKRAS